MEGIFDMLNNVAITVPEVVEGLDANAVIST
jgi:hypothetical protein